MDPKPIAVLKVHMKSIQLVSGMNYYSSCFNSLIQTAIAIKKMLDQSHAPMQIYKGKPKNKKNFQIKSQKFCEKKISDGNP